MWSCHWGDERSLLLAGVGKKYGQCGCLFKLIIKDYFLFVFQQPEEDADQMRCWSPSFSVTFVISFLFPFSLPPLGLPLAPVPPVLSGSCSWSSTPCCGWSNGTKSGVSVRFGPLQPATALAHSGVRAKAQRCGMWSVDSSFHQCLAVSCSTMYGNKRLMTPCTTITLSSLPFKNHFCCTTDSVTDLIILEFTI